MLQLKTIFNSINTWKLISLLLLILVVLQYVSSPANAQDNIPNQIVSEQKIAETIKSTPPVKKQPVSSTSNAVQSDAKVSGIKKTNEIIAHSAQDLNCLAKNIYYEARGEPLLGKYAVAQVTINRVKHKAFSKSICGVVYQPYQFSWTRNKGASPGGKAWTESKTIALNTLNGHRVIGLDNALYFHATYVNPGWKNMKKAARIGQHVFYNKA